MDGDQCIAYLTASPSIIQKIAQREEVPGRLCHLGSLDHKVRAVHPVADEGFLAISCTLALGYLGLVVRKNVVHAAAMDVDGLAEQSGSHSAALDVPTGPSFAPGALPANSTILPNPGLPKRKVGDGLLVVFVAGNPLAGTLTLEVDMGELPVVWKRGNAKIDGAVLRLVGVSALHERPDHGDHPSDLLRISGCGIGLGGTKS